MDTGSFRVVRTTVTVALVAVLTATLFLVQEHSPKWCLGELRTKLTYWLTAILRGGFYSFCRSKKSLIDPITTDNCIVDSLGVLASFKRMAT